MLTWTLLVTLHWLGDEQHIGRADQAEQTYAVYFILCNQTWSLIFKNAF